MSDDLPNLPTLIKLLKMTTSSNDNEALNAIRMANVALKKFGGDWEALLKGKVTVIGDPFSGTNIPNAGAPIRRAPQPAPTPPRPQPRPQPAPRQPPPPPPPPSMPVYSTSDPRLGPRVDAAIANLLDKILPQWEAAFLADIRKTWRIRGFLTSKQGDKLMDINSKSWPKQRRPTLDKIDSLFDDAT